MLKIIIISTLFLHVFGFSALSLERFDIVTTGELENLLAVREQGQADFCLINTLDEIIYRNASIPGSINIPWSRVGETIHRAGDDKDKLLVFY